MGTKPIGAGAAETGAATPSNPSATGGPAFRERKRQAIPMPANRANAKPREAGKWLSGDAKTTTASTDANEATTGRGCLYGKFSFRLLELDRRRATDALHSALFRAAKHGGVERIPPRPKYGLAKVSSAAQIAAARGSSTLGIYSGSSQ